MAFTPKDTTAAINATGSFSEGAISPFSSTRTAIFCKPSDIFTGIRYKPSWYVQNIDAYNWSSHKGYTSIARKWDWLHKHYILSLVSKNRKDWLRYYKKWVAEDTEDEISQKIGGVKWPVCFGSQAFVDRIKEKYGAGKLDKEVPSSRELLPNVTLIIETVCSFFDVSDSEIFKSRRGKTNEARNAAIYLTRKLRRDTLKDIGARFEIHNERTVRSVVERMRIQLRKDRDLVRQLDKLTEFINKGQKST